LTACLPPREFSPNILRINCKAEENKMRWHVHKGSLVVVLGTVGFLPTLGDAAAPEVTEPPYFSGQVA
jgi:hypothetical protein